jgi:hypothetical protein
VRLDGDEAGEPTLPEHRRVHGHVVQVIAVPRVRIVVDEDIALAEGLQSPVPDRRLDGEAQVPLEDGEPNALGDHLHVRIEDRAAEVQALADDVVVGGLDHGDAHALGGGIERGAHHFHGHGVERLIAHVRPLSPR